VVLSLAGYDALSPRLLELSAIRFKEFEQEVIHQKNLADRAAKFNKEREKRRLATDNVGYRAIFPEADSCPQMEDSTESWLMSLASDQ